MGKPSAQADAQADVSRVAVIYTRVSSVGQEDNYSLPQQEADSQAYCGRMGYSVLRVQNDGAAKSYTLNRPGLQAAMADIEEGRAGVLVVGKYDRFSRDQDQQTVAIWQIQQAGGRVESATERNEGGALGKGIRNLFGMVAEMELENIRKRTQGGRKARARAGKLIPSGYPLYGYVWADPDERRGKTRYLPDEESIDGNPEHAPAAVVRRIHTDVARGMSLAALARALMDEGVPAPLRVLGARGMLPRGRGVSDVWYRVTLWRILSHPAYAGAAVAYRWKVEQGTVRDEFGRIMERTSIRQRDEDDEARVLLPPETVPPLVDEATASAARAQMERNKAEAARHNPDPEACLLRGGYAVCGYCGGTLGTSRRRERSGNQYWVYRCRRRNAGELSKEACEAAYLTVYANVLDALAWAFTRHIVSHPEMLRDALDRLRSESDTEGTRAARELAAVEGTLADLEEQAKNLMRGIREQSVPYAREMLTRELDDLALRIESLNKRRDALRADVRTQGDAAANLRAFEEWATIAGRNLDGATYAQRRTMLYALGVSARVWRADHAPRFLFRADFKGLRTGMDTAVFEMTDAELAALSVHCVADNK